MGAGGDFCAQRLGTDRGALFDQVYRIQAKLGRFMAEVEPYPLFPLDEYFGGAVRPTRTKSLISPARPASTRLRLPLSA